MYTCMHTLKQEEVYETKTDCMRYINDETFVEKDDESEREKCGKKHACSL